jgi:hypothetical protein
MITEMRESGFRPGPGRPTGEPAGGAGANCDDGTIAQRLVTGKAACRLRGW